nr:MAG TPA: hypothetical protein [Bacteriophage sp.]
MQNRTKQAILNANLVCCQISKNLATAGFCRF